MDQRTWTVPADVKNVLRHVRDDGMKLVTKNKENDFFLVEEIASQI